MPVDLDQLASRMGAEAAKLERAGGGAARIARAHFSRMIEKARAMGLGSPGAAQLVELRRQLYAVAGEMRWELAGVGNRESWAFKQVVEALRTADAAAKPLLAMVGVKERLPVDQNALAAAFQRLDGTFARASVDAAELVRGEVVRMVTAGVEPKVMAERLVASNLIDPGVNMSVEQRAETIARTETMRVYRQAVRAKAEKAGLDHFRMVGPVTARTSNICRSFVGRVMPASDWAVVMGERWDGEHANRGFHPNCRHSWQPVKPEWVKKEKGDYSRTDRYNTEIAQQHDKDESFPQYSMDELRAMPASQRAEILGSSDKGVRLVA